MHNTAYISGKDTNLQLITEVTRKVTLCQDGRVFFCLAPAEALVCSC